MPLLVQGGPALGDFPLRDRLRNAMITGAAITIPLIVTLVVLGFVLNFVSNALNPVVTVVYDGIGFSSVPRYGVKIMTAVTLVVTVFVVGLVAQQRPDDGSFENSFDQMMARIPGVGSIYTSFNEMSELLLDSDTDSFQEVKLVEYPDEGSYTVAFLTADTPDRVQHAAGHDEMQTLFLPMAPNPVMGGFVIHVSEDRVIDTDMTVQQGIRSIVTSGVAVEEDPDHALSADEMQRLSEDPRVKEVAGAEPPGTSDHATSEPGERRSRRERYDDDVDPEFVRRPDGIVRRERPDPDDDAAADGAPRTPSDLESLRDGPRDDGYTTGDDRQDGQAGAGTETRKADDDEARDTE